MEGDVEVEPIGLVEPLLAAPLVVEPLLGAPRRLPCVFAWLDVPVPEVFDPEFVLPD